MLDPAHVRAVMKALGGHLDIPFVRSDQDGERCGGMSFSWKIIQQGQEPAYMNAIARANDPDDETVVAVREECLSRGTVSLNFFGAPAQYDALSALTQKAADWFDSDEGKEACKSNYIFPIAEERQIQDRAAILEAGYEARLGFDVRVIGRRVTSSTEDAVDISATIKSLEEVTV